MHWWGTYTSCRSSKTSVSWQYSCSNPSHKTRTLNYSGNQAGNENIGEIVFNQISPWSSPHYWRVCFMFLYRGSRHNAGGWDLWDFPAVFLIVFVIDICKETTDKCKYKITKINVSWVGQSTRWDPSWFLIWIESRCSHIDSWLMNNRSNGYSGVQSVVAVLASARNCDWYETGFNT